MSRALTQIYFSPSGSTEKIVRMVTSAFSGNAVSVDLLQHGGNGFQMGRDELLVVGMPVFAGRIPSLCRDMLDKYRGNGTPAIAIVSYGNRAYEDALLELTELLQGNGFSVIGAGAFAARHSIFPKVGAGRPDVADESVIMEFASKCVNKLAGLEEGREYEKLVVKGNSPYREPSAVPLVPFGNADCSKCGLCVRICPVQAIDAGNPRNTDKDLCIACTACIHMCPKGGRAFRGLKYMIASRSFKKKCKARQNPEYFV